MSCWHTMFDPHRDDPKVHRLARGANGGTSLVMRIILPSIVSAIVLLLIFSYCRDSQYRARQGAMGFPSIA